MKWHEVKEQAAGEKRLLLLWYIYKFFGKNIVKFIVLFVTFFALLGAKKIKESSKKYLKIIGQKDSFYNIFRHCLSYSYALIDRMEIFSDTFHQIKLSLLMKKVEFNFLKIWQKKRECLCYAIT